MEYRGIGINIHRKRCIVKAQEDGSAGRGKDTTVNITSVVLDIFGVPALDDAFIFELKSILEEFIGKKLGQISGLLNSNSEALGEGYTLSISREDSLLAVSVKDTDNGKLYVSRLNMIHAKTLYSILSKTIQTINIQ